MKNTIFQSVTKVSALLARKSRVRNALIAAYVLIVLGISATARAEMSTMPIFVSEKQVQTKTFTGEIAISVDGEAYLVVSERAAFQLKSNIDLTEFNGQHVEVVGYELKHRAGPVRETQLMSLDPLQGDAGLVTEPVLVVFDIREVTSQE